MGTLGCNDVYGNVRALAVEKTLTASTYGVEAPATFAGFDRKGIHIVEGTTKRGWLLAVFPLLLAYVFGIEGAPVVDVGVNLVACDLLCV